MIVIPDDNRPDDDDEAVLDDQALADKLGVQPEDVAWARAQLAEIDNASDEEAVDLFLKFYDERRGEG